MYLQNYAVGIRRNYQESSEPPVGSKKQFIAEKGGLKKHSLNLLAEPRFGMIGVEHSGKQFRTQI